MGDDEAHAGVKRLIVKGVDVRMVGNAADIKIGPKGIGDLVPQAEKQEVVQVIPADLGVVKPRKAIETRQGQAGADLPQRAELRCAADRSRRR